MPRNPTTLERCWRNRLRTRISPGNDSIVPLWAQGTFPVWRSLWFQSVFPLDPRYKLLLCCLIRGKAAAGDYKKKEKRFRLHSICSGLSVTLGSRVHAQPYFQGVSSHTKYFLEKPQEHSALQEQDVFVCQCVDLETDRIRKYM